MSGDAEREFAEGLLAHVVAKRSSRKVSPTLAAEGSRRGARTTGIRTGADPVPAPPAAEQTAGELGGMIIGAYRDAMRRRGSRFHGEPVKRFMAW